MDHVCAIYAGRFVFFLLMFIYLTSESCFMYTIGAALSLALYSRPTYIVCLFSLLFISTLNRGIRLIERKSLLLFENVSSIR